MATEYTQEKYYDHARFVNTHNCVKIAVEQFLAKTVFQNDKTRLVYSTDDMCFRKRVESVDLVNGVDDTTTANIVNLKLPFSSYYQVENWSEDDRLASVQASEMVLGHYDKTTFNRLKAMAVKAPYKATIFFGRDDDARLAHQILLWEQNPKQPVWLYGLVEWYGAQLAVPCFVTIDKLDYNPSYKESDWLTKSRIIPITVEMTVRSYTILLDEVANQILPYKFGELYQHKNKSLSDTVLTEKAILTFASEKHWGVLPSTTTGSDTTWPRKSTEIDKANEEDVVSANATSRFVDREMTVDEVLHNELKPKDTTIDVLSSYFMEKTDVAMNACTVNTNLTTSDTLVLNTIVKPADYQYFEKLVISVPGHADVCMTDCKQKTTPISGLYPNSEYHLTVLVYSTTGTIRTIRLTGTTKDNATNEAPTTTKKNYGELVGMSWS